VAEIAAAVMLLVGAGLLARTFWKLRLVNVGFNTGNLLVLRITPDAARYRTGAQTTDYYGRVLRSLREVPSIELVAAITSLPMSTTGSDFKRPFWPAHARPDGNAVPSASRAGITRAGRRRRTIGMIGAAGGSRLARTLLFGVAPQIRTLATAAAVLPDRGRRGQLVAGTTGRADRPGRAPCASESTGRSRRPAAMA
jgi:hypothetical protein